MTTFQEIKQKFMTTYAHQEERRSAIEAEAKKAREAALRYYGIAARKMGEYHKLTTKAWMSRDTHWTDDLVLPILQEVDRITGLNFHEDNSLNTFGLRCECPVFAKDENGNVLAYLCFTPGDVEKGQVFIDTGEKSYAECSPNSLAALNGYDNVREEVTSIEVIIDNIKRNNPDLKLQPTRP